MKIFYPIGILIIGGFTLNSAWGSLELMRGTGVVFLVMIAFYSLALGVVNGRS